MGFNMQTIRTMHWIWKSVHEAGHCWLFETIHFRVNLFCFYIQHWTLSPYRISSNYLRRETMNNMLIISFLCDPYIFYSYANIPWTATHPGFTIQLRSCLSMIWFICDKTEKTWKRVEQKDTRWKKWSTLDSL